MSSIVYLKDFAKAQPVTKAPSANLVSEILTSMVDNNTKIIDSFSINVNDPDIAFDIATLHYLFLGLAHRSQGESHPSQTILNAIKDKMLSM